MFNPKNELHRGFKATSNISTFTSQDNILNFKFDSL